MFYVLCFMFHVSCFLFCVSRPTPVSSNHPDERIKETDMHILDVFAHHPTTFSFEFFPPKTDQAAEQLFAHVRELETLRPAFVSVTYGAAGSTRERTHALVTRIKDNTSLNPVPHLTCIAHSQPDISQILETYAAHNIQNILALAGDPPPGSNTATGPAHDRTNDAFRYAADLVQFIRKFQNHPDPRGFGIGVAGFPEGHPATPNRTLEMDYLKAKIDAGADYIVTQLFFDNRDFYDFKERCEIARIKVPIIAGLMPITSPGTWKRIPELALGTRYPARLQRSVQRALSGGENDADAVKRVGIHWATEQARDLLDHNVRGIHFYTLNHSHATREIYKTLSLAPPAKTL
jgi:methylenetetrahydrofolate reductase (NADPH)